MSEEQFKAFLEKVKADTSLQEKLKGAADSDAVLSIANEAGFSISADDLAEDWQNLSTEELESLAGGARHSLSRQTACWTGCSVEHNCQCFNRG